MIVQIPLPPKPLHPNARAGWQAKHRNRSKYRQQAADLAWRAVAEQCQGDRPKLERATIRLTYFFGAPRKGGRRQKQDPDNLIAWAKTAIDSLQDAGILADDRELIYLPPRQDADEVRPRLEITVEPIGASEFEAMH